MKDTTIHMLIDSELKKAAQEAAKKDDRTLANWIQQAIKEKLEKASGK